LKNAEKSVKGQIEFTDKVLSRPEKQIEKIKKLGEEYDNLKKNSAEFDESLKSEKATELEAEITSLGTTLASLGLAFDSSASSAESWAEAVAGASKTLREERAKQARYALANATPLLAKAFKDNDDLVQQIGFVQMDENSTFTVDDYVATHAGANLDMPEVIRDQWKGTTYDLKDGSQFFDGLRAYLLATIFDEFQDEKHQPHNSIFDSYLGSEELKAAAFNLGYNGSEGKTMDDFLKAIAFGHISPSTSNGSLIQDANSVRFGGNTY